MIDSKYTNRKTVISRPTVSDKIDNLGKSGNKDSIKLVSTKDVENIVQKAQDNVNEVTIPSPVNVHIPLHVADIPRIYDSRLFLPLSAW